jgi:hypothetical protein
MIIFFALLTSIIKPIADLIFIDFEFSEQLRKTFSNWMSGDIDSFRGLFREIGNFISQESHKTNTTIINSIIVYVIFMFFIQMTNIPITKVLYNKMSQGYDERFHMSLISTLILALKYSFVNAITGALLDLLIFVFGIVLLSLLFPLISIYSITIAVFVMLILLSIRISFTIMLPPIMVAEEKKVFKALVLSIKRTPKILNKIFIPVFIVIITTFAICMCTVAVTFGIIPIIIIPTYMVLMSAISLIVYFVDNKRKYYTTNVLDFNGRVDYLPQSSENDAMQAARQSSESEEEENELVDSECDTKTGEKDSSD